MNEIPKSGEIYQHFKGGRYKILGISKACRRHIGSEEMEVRDYVNKYWARDCEHPEEEYDVFDSNGKLFINGIRKNCVIYESLYSGEFPIGTIWFRSLKYSGYSC
jgi:hypothetical protein